MNNLIVTSAILCTLILAATTTSFVSAGLPPNSALLWSTQPLKPPGYSVGEKISSIDDSSPLAVVVVSAHGIYGLNPSDGKLLWTAKPPNQATTFISPVTVDTVNNLAFVLADDTTVYGFDIRTGVAGWKYNVGSASMYPLTTGSGKMHIVHNPNATKPNDRLLVFANAGDVMMGQTVFVVRIMTATAVWSQGGLILAGGPYLSWTRNGTALVITVSSPFASATARALTTGDVMWTFALKSKSNPMEQPSGYCAGATPDSSAAGTVYCSSLMWIFAIDADTGAQRFRFPAPGAASYAAAMFWSSGFISTQGSMFDNGNMAIGLYAINGSNGVPAHQSPPLADPNSYSGTVDCNLLNSATDRLAFAQCTGAEDSHLWIFSGDLTQRVGFYSMPKGQFASTLPVANGARGFTKNAHFGTTLGIVNCIKLS